MVDPDIGTLTKKINKGKKVYVDNLTKNLLVEWYDYYDIPLDYKVRKNGYYVYKPSMLHWSLKKWAKYIFICILSGFVLSCVAYLLYTTFINIKF